ncbi:hypothetical protein PR048_008315 [Dryococelus australis]|uniref:Uncharacterized protein n=1 Tax=Dryococelus australis TaxID=614101 RepID=A0ABQ9HWS7_9NEOP|nr:hypothetical protein PR048_008315 [Dryococelus australis]
MNVCQIPLPHSLPQIRALTRFPEGPQSTAWLGDVCSSPRGSLSNLQICKSWRTFTLAGGYLSTRAGLQTHRDKPGLENNCVVWLDGTRYASLGPISGRIALPVKWRYLLPVQTFPLEVEVWGEVRILQRRNTRAGGTGDPRGNPPTSGSTVRHDSHLRKSGVSQPDNVAPLKYAYVGDLVGGAIGKNERDLLSSSANIFRVDRELSNFGTPMLSERLNETTLKYTHTNCRVRAMSFFHDKFKHDGIPINNFRGPVRSSALGLSFGECPVTKNIPRYLAPDSKGLKSLHAADYRIGSSLNTLTQFRKVGTRRDSAMLSSKSTVAFKFVSSDFGGTMENRKPGWLNRDSNRDPSECKTKCLPLRHLARGHMQNPGLASPPGAFRRSAIKSRQLRQYTRFVIISPSVHQHILTRGNAGTFTVYNYDATMTLSWRRACARSWWGPAAIGANYGRGRKFMAYTFRDSDVLILCQAKKYRLYLSKPRPHPCDHDIAPPRLFRRKFSFIGAAVINWLDYSAPTKMNRVRFPARSHPDFHMRESCWTISLVSEFSRDLLFLPTLHSGSSPSSALKISMLRSTSPPRSRTRRCSDARSRRFFSCRPLLSPRASLLARRLPLKLIHSSTPGSEACHTFISFALAIWKKSYPPKVRSGEPPKGYRGRMPSQPNTLLRLSLACHSKHSIDLVPHYHITTLAFSSARSRAAAQGQRRRPATLLILLAYHQGEPFSIPDRVTPGFTQVGIVPDVAAGRWVIAGISRFPALAFRRYSILTSLPSSTFRTSVLRAPKSLNSTPQIQGKARHRTRNLSKLRN